MRHGRTLLFAAGISSAVLAVGFTTTLSNPFGESTLETSRKAARVRMIEKLKTKHQKPYDEPQEAVQFYWSKRSPDGAPMSIAPLEEAEQEAAALAVHTTGRAAAQRSSRFRVATNSTLSGAWQALGPGNIGGRSRALLIHRTQNNLMWTAGVAGGIWKSTDSGASWTPKGDLLVNIAVNSLIQDAALDNVLYAGTGEGFFNIDAARGQGIFKSTDYGETWSQLPATDNSDFFYVNKLATTNKKPQKDHQRIYAATRTGLFRSIDAGASWTKVIEAAAVRGCTDVVLQQKADANEQRYVYASCGTLAQATIYRAADVSVGQVWEPVLSQQYMGRTSLAVAPSNPNVVYALSSYYNPAGDAKNDGLRAVYRSTQSGATGTWETRVDHTATNKINKVQLTNPVYAHLGDCGFGGPNQNLNQGWYDNGIAVDPKDENIVWTAGVDLMRSDDGGANWGVASYWWFDPTDPNYSHADQHAITFHPKYNGDSNRQMFVASDGGVHRTDDARAAVGTTLAEICGSPSASAVQWTALNNGYEVTQFYHGAVYPDGNTYFGGTQDNGTLRGTNAGTSWGSIRGGDGGYVAVNSLNTNIIYAENTGKSLQRSTNGGTTWFNIHGGVTEGAGNFQFIHPFAMDPTNSNRMYYGGAFAWRSNNSGTNWTRISEFFSARIASWGIAPSNPNRVYAGVQHLGTTTSGRIFTTATATTAVGPSIWASAQPRQGYVSSIAVDPINPAVAYATYSTYNFGTHLGHVFKTVNSGATWTRIDLTLPDMPVHSVVVHPTQPNTLYIGTDLGVFVTTDGGVSWMRENTGFANVVTEHLELKGMRLYAFTHGRSVWSVTLN